MGDVYDVSTGEFASGSPGLSKFSADHYKVLRESKIILDNHINSKYISKAETRRIIVPSFQATGLDGEVKIIKPVAPGLYTRHSDFKLATRESVLPTSNRRGIPEEIHGNKDLAECVAHTVPAEDFFVACFIIKSPNEQGAKRPLEEDNNLDAPTQNFAKKKKKKKAALTQ
ncbi:hypothetical protein INT48_006677 [Thamnidium elegans]|uniref:Uncharacterized protein n=1 Tax=Thamnidium elegans TaxID=101142 RepID=A0A8H7SHV0_9FUNG|nr:hypothetical protein INT48_006677 [Thamnidium elegans]